MVAKKIKKASSRSILIDILVGLTVGIVLFVFVAFVITVLPSELQGQKNISVALQFILIEAPTVPVRRATEFLGYSLSEGMLFSSSVVCYAIAGGIINVVLQRIKK